MKTWNVVQGEARDWISYQEWLIGKSLKTFSKNYESFKVTNAMDGRQWISCSLMQSEVCFIKAHSATFLNQCQRCKAIYIIFISIMKKLLEAQLIAAGMKVDWALTGEAKAADNLGLESVSSRSAASNHFTVIMRVGLKWPLTGSPTS